MFPPHPNSTLLGFQGALQHRGLIGFITAEQLSSSIKALVVMGCPPPDARCQRMLLLAAYSCWSGFGPRQWSNFAWSIAAARFEVPVEWLERLVQAATAHIISTSLSPPADQTQPLSQARDGISKSIAVGTRPESLPRAFSALELVSFASSLTRLGYRPPSSMSYSLASNGRPSQSWLSCLQSASGPMLGSLSDENLARLLVHVVDIAPYCSLPSAEGGGVISREWMLQVVAACRGREFNGRARVAVENSLSRLVSMATPLSSVDDDAEMHMGGRGGASKVRVLS